MKDWFLIDNVKCEVLDINRLDEIGKMCAMCYAFFFFYPIFREPLLSLQTMEIESIFRLELF